VAAYTVTRGLVGKVEGLAGEFTNAVILIVAPLTGNECLLEDLRKLLSKSAACV
jgi:hypothetical protein